MYHRIRLTSHQHSKYDESAALQAVQNVGLLDDISKMLIPQDMFIIRGDFSLQRITLGPKGHHSLAEPSSPLLSERGFKNTEHVTLVIGERAIEFGNAVQRLKDSRSDTYFNTETNSAYVATNVRDPASSSVCETKHYAFTKQAPTKKRDNANHVDLPNEQRIKRIHQTPRDDVEDKFKPSEPPDKFSRSRSARCNGLFNMLALLLPIWLLAIVSHHGVTYEEVEPARRRKLLDTSSHGATKYVTSYCTLMPSTSGTACKTPDDDGVCLCFLIPVDLDKLDEIAEESSPIDDGKLLPHMKGYLSLTSG
uniref:Uncharacterized protein n=1 Tax=Glossina pallidipes TaxID=7398 RepID=A0A1B0ACB0_GLOPL